MRVYSYVVARDFGFAPNPFHSWCTLATCKPEIRKTEQVGDWIIGTGSATKSRAGRAVYAMRVAEILTFEQYWKDPRFLRKAARPARQPQDRVRRQHLQPRAARRLGTTSVPPQPARR